jgi:hypothetical protein
MAKQVVPIEAVKGDITTELVDAIVNAAGGSLLSGRRGWRGDSPGSRGAPAGGMSPTSPHEIPRWPSGRRSRGHRSREPPARWVTNTVGPNRHVGQTDPALFASCFETSPTEAVKVGAGRWRSARSARVSMVRKQPTSPVSRSPRSGFTPPGRAGPGALRLVQSNHPRGVRHRAKHLNA